MAEDQLQARLQKLEMLRRLGINPFPHSYTPTHRLPQLAESQEEGLEVKIAGRVTLQRTMGRNSRFWDLSDQRARLQVYFKLDELNDGAQFLDLVDLGDFIGVRGQTFRTRTQEYTVRAKEVTFLSKALRPLPDKHHGLRDPELRYALRSLDLLSNQDVAEVFLKRSRAVSAMRQVLDGEGFLEVDIPYLQPVYGGASAKPFLTHVNALDRDYYLSISPELYLKRLVVGGLDAVYTIARNFRNEGIDRSHNPEFTMMECYRAYFDYRDMMNLTERIVASMAEAVVGSTLVQYGDDKLDFTPPWKRVSMYDAVREVTGLKLYGVSEDELKAAIGSHGDLHVSGFEAMTKGQIVEALFDEYVAPNLVQPVFIIDHPAESTNLCKVHRSNPELIERFEPYAAGMEIGNAYTELNDAVYQRQLLVGQIEKEGADNPHLKLDEPFLRALEQGMPPTGGLGIGVDRLVMILTNQRTLKDVLLFPMTKAEIK